MDEGKVKQLIADYLKGDEKSLEILIKKYLKPVYGFAYKYVGNSQEAEDITQEVFVKMWKNLKNFDQQKYFKPWLFSIAKNTALDFLKKSRSAEGRKKAVPFSEFENEKGENVLAETIAESSPLPPEILERKDALGALAKAMVKLLPKYRETVVLRNEEDMTFRQIADKAGESVNTVKSRHRRALILLKKFLDN